jgi:TctA family transporter
LSRNAGNTDTRFRFRLTFGVVDLFDGIDFVVLAMGVLGITELIMAVFGVLGYVFVKLNFEPAPLLLGLVLGPMMEENLRRAMTISRGDPAIFVTRPISLALLACALLLLLAMLVPSMARRREKIF